MLIDKTSSEAIAQFGLERHLEQLEKPLPVYKKRKQLTREGDQIISERTIVKNKLRAEKAEDEPNKNILNQNPKKDRAPGKTNHFRNCRINQKE